MVENTRRTDWRCCGYNRRFFHGETKSPGKEWKISRLNVGYQKADDYTVSLKRIEFALERVKLRERTRERAEVKEEEEEEEEKERARAMEKDDRKGRANEQ